MFAEFRLAKFIYSCYAVYFYIRISDPFYLII